MCLSTVYINETETGNIVTSDVINAIDTGNGVNVYTILGIEKNFDGYFINEINLTENYILLKKKETENASQPSY